MSTTSSWPTSVRFYLCGRFSSRHDLKKVRDDLIAAGHSCTADWLDEPYEIAAHAAQNANRDLDSLDRADAVICFTTAPRASRSRGGRHFEAGWAAAKGKAVIVVGPVEHIFYELFESFSDWPSALAALQARVSVAIAA